MKYHIAKEDVTGMDLEIELSKSEHDKVCKVLDFIDAAYDTHVSILSEDDIIDGEYP